jgi:CrcB protein
MGHPLRRVETLALVALGGFVGSSARQFVALQAPGLAGTLFVNVLGCVLLGFLLYEALYAGVLAGQTRTVVGTGLLASFTTYSTFAVEAATAPPPVLVGYVLATYALGFAGVLAGRALAARTAGGRPEEGVA